ncbi:MAG: hypothetical protein KDI71_09350 [Xanthomonadales bacterium]|nr:hypothetical protein [Xanthomonadales bacterium]
MATSQVAAMIHSDQPRASPNPHNTGCGKLSPGRYLQSVASLVRASSKPQNEEDFFIQVSFDLPIERR